MQQIRLTKDSEFRRLDVAQTDAKAMVIIAEDHCPQGFRVDYEICRRHDSPGGTRVNLHMRLIPRKPRR